MAAARIQRDRGLPRPAVSRIAVSRTRRRRIAQRVLATARARALRGLYPRKLLNEQSFWTVVGSPTTSAKR